MIGAARIWREEPRILTRMPFELSCVSHTAHYRVEVRARDGGELLWVRPYRTKQEAIRAYYGLVGLSPVSKPRELIVTVATIATFTSSVNNAGLTWDAGGSKCPIGVSSVRYLVAAGGANGGDGNSQQGGGGGAGGFLTATGLVVTPGVNYPVTVGAAGQSSVFSSITSNGGGAGGVGAGGVGGTGGSGGGTGSKAMDGITAGGAGTAGQGNNGGSGSRTGGHMSGGGGGGAGTPGGPGATAAPELERDAEVTPRIVQGGAGGNGLSSNISGVATSYCAGGGGSSTQTSGFGGNQGGGNGSSTSNGGAATTRGSGGGAGGLSGAGGAGMPGIVILEFTIVAPPPSAGFNMPMMGM